jgi:hypothetical protein
MQSPESRREKARQELISWQARKDHEKESEESKDARLQTVAIKHDLLQAVKRERDLEFKSKRIVVEEEPKKEEKKEEVQLVLVSGRWKRKKKKNG